MGFFDKLKERVNKTRENFSTKVNSVIKNFRKVDEEFFEELEEALILSDIGYATTEKVIETLRDRVKEEKISDPAEIKDMLIHILAEYMTDVYKRQETDCVVRRIYYGRYRQGSDFDGVGRYPA